MLNSTVVKLSKLTRAAPVYRGTSNGVLPKTFWEKNEQGVRGGVDAAFMSTTRDRSVAVGYASGATPMIFEMQQGATPHHHTADPVTHPLEQPARLSSLLRVSPQAWSTAAASSRGSASALAHRRTHAHAAASRMALCILT